MAISRPENEQNLITPWAFLMMNIHLYSYIVIYSYFQDLKYFIVKNWE